LLAPNLNANATSLIDSLDFCNYALQINGLLTKPATYYMESDVEVMEQDLIRLGTTIYDRIGDSANVTMTAPLVSAVKQIGLLRIFLTSSMATVVVFLAILSI